MYYCTSKQMQLFWSLLSMVEMYSDRVSHAVAFPMPNTSVRFRDQAYSVVM